MKSLRFVTIVIAILSISACSHAQIRRTVTGDHNVVSKEREAGSFDALKVSAGIDVYLKQGSKESITVEADENLQEYILTEVRGGVLDVYTEVNIRSAEKKRVYVTMKDIKSVSTSSAGDVVGESSVKSDNLRLSASSAGDIKLEVYSKNIDLSISSSGDMTLSGEADMLEADLSSAGNLNAFGLQLREAEISVSSAGDADINVSEKIKARASSAGDINYKGDPKYVDFHSSSAGGIHKR